MKRCPKAGDRPAPPAMISWTRSAYCNTMRMASTRSKSFGSAPASGPPILRSRKTRAPANSAAQFRRSVRANRACSYEIAQVDLSTRDFSRRAIGRCLTEILAHFPVYRTYAEVSHFSGRQRIPFAGARGCQSDLPSERSMVGRHPGRLALRQEDSTGDEFFASGGDEAISATERASLRQGCGRHGVLPLRPADLAQRCRLRRSTIFLLDTGVPRAHAGARGWASARHARYGHARSRKRGEDVRARLAVLSELAGEWSHAVKRWLRLAASRRREIDGIWMRTKEILSILFQTIVGAWPHGLATRRRARLSRLLGSPYRVATKGSAGSQTVE